MTAHPLVEIIPSKIVERGLELVQTAHRLELKKPVNVCHKKYRVSLGKYTKPGICIDSTNPAAWWTFIHELGHHLDYEELGSSSCRPCTTERGSELSRLVKLMRASKVYGEILACEDLSNYRRRYYARAVELWARAYTQFVLRRCASAGFEDEGMRTQGPFMWDEKDFDPIYDEILAVFSAKGWV